LPADAQLVDGGRKAGDRAAGRDRRAVFQVGTGISKNPRISALFAAKSLILEKTPSSTDPVFSSDSPRFPSAPFRPRFTLSLFKSLKRKKKKA
jgi:hypothetical protein